VRKLILTLLVIPLMIVMVTRDPQGAGRLAELIITIGARLLNAVAVTLSDLLGSHPGLHSRPCSRGTGQEFTACAETIAGQAGCP